MAYAKQRGQAKNGEIEQGDLIRLEDGCEGEVESFSGGRHDRVWIRSGGYTYVGDTRTAKKIK